MDVILYVRVSTEEQGGGTSLETQERDLRVWAASVGGSVVAVHQDLVSGTAEISQRPGLVRALEDLAEACDGRPALKRGQPAPADAPRLCCWRRDRLARDTGVVAAIESVVAGYGAVVSSLDVAMDEGPEALLMRRILDAFAEYERVKILVRTALGKAQARRHGRFPGGQPPWGAAAENGELRWESVEARETVKTCIGMYQGGYTFTEIAEWLNARGIETRNGARWTHVQARRLVESPWYTRML